MGREHFLERKERLDQVNNANFVYICIFLHESLWSGWLQGQGGLAGQCVLVGQEG